MRIGLIGSSLLPKSGVTLNQVRWSDSTAQRLRDAIGNRGPHGLDRADAAPAAIPIFASVIAD